MNKERYLLITFLIMVMVMLFYWQDILPLKKQLSLYRWQEIQFTRQLQRLYYQEMLLEGKMADMPETKFALNEWQKKFIKQNDINKLIKEIIAISQRDKLQITVLRVGSAARENNYTKQPLNMVLLGDYAKISRFAEQIANLPWTVVIGDFSLAKTAQDNNYSAEMALYIYYLSGGGG